VSALKTNDPDRSGLFVPLEKQQLFCLETKNLKKATKKVANARLQPFLLLAGESIIYFFPVYNIPPVFNKFCPVIFII